MTTCSGSSAFEVSASRRVAGTTARFRPKMSIVGFVKIASPIRLHSKLYLHLFQPANKADETVAVLCGVLAHVE